MVPIAVMHEGLRKYTCQDSGPLTSCWVSPMNMIGECARQRSLPARARFPLAPTLRHPRGRGGGEDDDWPVLTTLLTIGPAKRDVFGRLRRGRRRPRPRNLRKVSVRNEKEWRALQDSNLGPLD